MKKEATIGERREAKGRRGRFKLCARLDALSVPMEPTEPPGEGTGACPCLYCGPASVPSAAWRRSVKRKLDGRGAEARFLSCAAHDAGMVRVEIENEVLALREAVASHQQTVQKLQAELEEERSAAASATTEAMSMILRLQRGKAEAQMEARQFKHLAEGKMAHNQQEIAALEDLLFKRDQAVQALSCEVQAYRHHLLSIGIGIDEYASPFEPRTADTVMAACSNPQFDLLPRDYPLLRCTDDDDDATDLDKFPSWESPREHFRKLEQMPSSSIGKFMDKGVVVGQSPRRQPRRLSFSYGSYGSVLEFNMGEEFPEAMDRASDCGGRDDMSDRVYPVDAVHGASEDYVSTPRELQNRRDVAGRVEEPEIRKLYMRLQALDAERESMRHTLMSMGMDKAQMLLKEIAQQTCKEVAPERRIIRKPPPVKGFSIMSIIKVDIYLSMFF